MLSTEKIMCFMIYFVRCFHYKYEINISSMTDPRLWQTMWRRARFNKKTIQAPLNTIIRSVVNEHFIAFSKSVINIKLLSEMLPYL